MNKFITRTLSVGMIAATLAGLSRAGSLRKDVNETVRRHSAVAMPAEPSVRHGEKEPFMLPIRQSATKGLSLRHEGEASLAPARTRTQAPVSGMPTIYGSVHFNSQIEAGLKPTGLYSIPNGETTATQLLFPGPSAGNAGVCVDGIYYSTSYYNIMGQEIILCEAYDMDTEELLGNVEAKDYTALAPGGYSLDPVSGKVYGITQNANKSGVQLTIMNFSGTTLTTETVAPITGNWIASAFDNTGQLYGIRYTGHYEGSSYVVDNSILCKIDKATAAVTTVGTLGVKPAFMTGACIDPATNRMFWNVMPADGSSWMYEVNLQTATATCLYRLDHDDEILGLFVPTPDAEPNAPAEVENLDFTLNGGSLTGKCTFKAPSKLFNGNAGTGNLTVHVEANNVEVASCNASWGQNISLDVTVPEAGKYTFKVYARNSNGKGPASKVRNLWVGHDTPVAPAATLSYTDGKMNVGWQAVDATINGGWLDASNLTYTVVRHKDGTDTEVAKGLKATSFTEPIAAPANGMTAVSYTVYAVAGNLQSAGGNTTSVILGGLVPPYTSDFASTGLTGWTVIDANNDGRTWELDQNEVKVKYNGSMAMDDYLISPPFMLKGGQTYTLSFNARASSNNFPERMEVLMGNQPEAAALTTKIVQPTDLTGVEPTRIDATLTPATDGLYYLGFHGISDADMYYLFLGNITVGGGMSGLAPAAASDLAVTPDPAGALKADVTFKAPAKTINGQSLSALAKVDVIRNGEIVKTFQTPAPGASLSYEDHVSASGTYTYEIVGQNAEGNGDAARASVFIGFDKPEAPGNVAIARTATDGEVTVSWDAVSRDVNGKTFPAGQVRYIVAKKQGSSWVPFTPDLTDTSYTYQAVEAGQQEFVQVAVFAKAADATGAGSTTDMIAVGTPYPTLHEGIANGKFSHIWAVRGIGGGTVEVLNDESGVTSQDGDGYMFAIKADNYDGGAELLSGLVSLAPTGAPELSFYTYNVALLSESSSSAGADINEIKVGIRTSDSEEWTNVYTNTVDKICAGSDTGWGKVTVALSQYAGKCIQFQITGITKKYKYTPIDNINLGSGLDHDLAASGLTAPAQATAGSTFKVAADITNYGSKTADNYSVELYADEVLVSTCNGTALAGGAKQTCEFEVSMSPLATEPMSIYAKVVYGADENPANDMTESISVTPVASELPGASDLKAESAEGGVKLIWSAPVLEGGTPAEVTDDFEDGESYAAEYGDWTFYDVDNSPVGGITNKDIPGITPAETTGSFWIWDTDILGGDSQVYTAHSGTKYLFSLYREDGGTVDDWAVSPKLSGTEQTISFYAKSSTNAYPEKIRVLYNTVDSTDPSTFTEVVVETMELPNEWTLIEASLPAGALHFAINGMATDALMLMIDDVTYTREDSFTSLELEGYDVFRNGVKVNNENIVNCEWLDSDVKHRETYSYVVVAKYADRGNGAGSNVATLTYNLVGIDSVIEGNASILAGEGKVIVLNAAGLPVRVATTDGAVIYNGSGNARMEISTGKGIFIVKAGNTLRKIIVK